MNFDVCFFPCYCKFTKRNSANAVCDVSCIEGATLLSALCKLRQAGCRSARKRRHTTATMREDRRFNFDVCFFSVLLQIGVRDQGIGGVMVWSPPGTRGLHFILGVRCGRGRSVKGDDVQSPMSARSWSKRQGRRGEVSDEHPDVVEASREKR